MRIINPTILCLLLCVINPVSAQDMSEWSDKTICRLAQAQKENLIFIEEAKLRSLPCVEMSVEKLSTTQVKKLQYDLAVMGFDVGSFDGKLSEKITSALETVLFDLDIKKESSLNLKLQRINQEARTIENRFPMGSYFDDFSKKRIANKYEITTGKRHPAGRKPYSLVNISGNQAVRIDAIGNFNVQDECSSNEECAQDESQRTDKFELRYVKKFRSRNPIWYGFKVMASIDFDYEKMWSNHHITFTQVKFRNPGGKVLGLLWSPNNLMTIGGSKTGNWDVLGRDYHTSRSPWLESIYTRLGDASRTAKGRHSELMSQSTYNIEPPFNSNSWTFYKIGISLEGNNPWVKVYQNNELIYQYDGAIYEITNEYYETVIGFGLYRTYNPFEKLPKQALIFDDFVVTGSEFVVDGYLGSTIE